MSSRRRVPSGGVSRRAVLTAVVLGGCLVGAGCTAEPDARVRPRPGPDEDPTPDPDIELASRTARELRSALESVRAVARRHERLAAALSPVAAAHAAQLELLANAVPDEGPTGRGRTGAGSPERTRDPERALHRVVELERDLNLSLRRHAFSAESGPFARLLASMSASAAQHAAVLSATTVRSAER